MPELSSRCLRYADPRNTLPANVGLVEEECMTVESVYAVHPLAGLVPEMDAPR